MPKTKRTKAVVLAAGKGKRLQSEGIDAPKVMRLAAGRPLLSYVLEALNFLAPEDTVIVVGYKREQIISEFSSYSFAVQEDQLGTGHALVSAADYIGDFDGDILVCCGDMPLLKRETYMALIDAHQSKNAACTLLSANSTDNLPFGRVLRESDGSFSRIVEEKDCTPQQLASGELNSGVYVFDYKSVLPALKELRRDNAQGEYYLTDAPALMKRRKETVEVFMRNLGTEIIGVNTAEQLAQVEEIVRLSTMS